MKRLVLLFFVLSTSIAGYAQSVTSITRNTTTPTNGDPGNRVRFTVLFSQTVEIDDLSNGFGLTTTGSISGASISSQSPSSGTSSSFIIEVDIGTGEGTIRLDVIDAAQFTPNLTGTFNSGEVYTIDKSDPVITPISIASNNANPALAMPGNTVTVSLTSNEPITIQEERIQSGGSTVDNTVSIGGTNPNYTLSVLMDASDDNGNVTFRFKATDEAGNQTSSFITAVTDGSSVVYDKTPPSITNISISSDNSDSDYAKENDEITLNFRITETLLSTPTVTFLAGGAPLVSSVSVNNSGSDYTATFTVGATDPEGDLTFNISATDLAGNTNSANTVTTGQLDVTIDTTPPVFDVVSITSDDDEPSAARAGEDVVLSVDPNEPLRGNLSASFLSGGAGINDGSISYNDNGTIYTAEYDVNSSDTDGLVTFSVTMTDLAGNQSTTTSTTDLSSVTIDVTEPDFLSSGMVTNTGGNNYFVVVTFTEPVYGNTAPARAVLVGADFDLVDNNMPSGINATVTGVTRADDSPSQVGDETYKVLFSLNQPPTGDTRIEVEEKGGASNNIFDFAGNDIVSNATTGELDFPDNFGPNILNATVENDNSFITIEFNEPAYGNAAANTGVTASDFDAVITTGIGDVTDATITNVLTLADGIPAGGETQLKVFISLVNGPATGDETIRLIPANNTSIFDVNGNGSDVASNPPFSSPTENLNDTKPPSLSGVSISSDNVANSTSLAIAGTDVTLSFTADEPLNIPSINVTFLSGGNAINDGSIDIQNPSANNYTATYTVNAGDTDGAVTFSIDYQDDAPAMNAGATVSTTNDASSVTVDKDAPDVDNITFTVDPIFEGSLTQKITVTFNESMQTSVIPGISISGSNWGSQNTTSPLGWVTNTQFEAEFTHDGDQEEITVNVSFPGSSGARDLAGNVANASSSFTFEVDTQKPTAAITYDDPAETVEDTYFRQGQIITIIATFNEDVNSTPAPQIRIFGTLNDNGGSPLPPIDVTNNMVMSSATVYTFDYTIPDGNGDLDIQILSAQDLPGNVVTANPTSGGSFTVDNIRPTLDLPANPLVPAVGGFNIPLNQGYQLTFSELIKGTGTNDISVSTTGFPQNVSSSTVQSNFSDNVVDFNLGANLQEQSSYEVLIPDGAFVDRAGNTFAGVGSGSWTFVSFGDPVITTIQDKVNGNVNVGCPGEELQITGDFLVGVDEIVFGSGGGSVTTTTFTLDANSNTGLSVTVPAGAPYGETITLRKNSGGPNNNFANAETTSAATVKIGPSSAQLEVVSPVGGFVCDDPTNSIDEATLRVNIVGGSGDYLVSFDDGDAGTPPILDLPYSTGETFNVNPPNGGNPGSNIYTLIEVKDADVDLDAISCGAPNLGSGVDVREYQRSVTDAGGISGVVEICLATQSSIDLLDVGDMGIIPSIVGSVTNGVWSIESGPTSGGGGFNSSFTNKTRNYDGSTSNVYFPSLADAATEGGIILKLTSNAPGGNNPCAASEDFLNIIFVSTTTVNTGLPPNICTNDPVGQLDGSFGGGASGLIWSTTTASAGEVTGFTGNDWGFSDDGNAPYTLTTTTQDAFYRFSPTEAAGSEAILEVVATVLPADQCGPAPSPKTLTLNAVDNPVTTGSTSELSVCSFDESVVYSVSSTSPNSTYTWNIPNEGTGPDDNKIVSGQGTNTIVVTFGNNTGTNSITVDQLRDDGCPADIFTYDVEVNPLPNVVFTPLVSNFSVQSDPVQLNENGTDASPLPDLGTSPEQTIASFAGPGVLINNANNPPGNPDTYFFDPSAVSLTESHAITYTVNDANGCENTTPPVLFTVFDASEALVFSSDKSTVPEEFCSDTDPFTVELSNAFLLGQLATGFEFSRFEGDGITDNGDQMTAVIDPGAPFELTAGGVIEVRYFQREILNPTNEVLFGSQPLIINPIPVPAPNPIPATFCSDDGIFPLSRDFVLNPTTSPGAVFSFEIEGGDPDGIIENPQPEVFQINPEAVPFAEDEFTGRIYTIRYSYTDGNSCTNETLIDVTFFQKPPAPIVSDGEFDCVEGDETLLEIQNQVEGATVNWYQTLEDVGVEPIDQGSTFNAALDPGTTVYYSTQIVNGCESEATRIAIGRIIQPAFERSGLCTDQVTSFEIVGEGLDLSTLNSITWRVREEGVLTNETILTDEAKSLVFPYTFTTPGVKVVSLQYESSLGCESDELIQEFFMMPSIKVANEYLEDFENTNNSWISWGFTQRDSIWENTIPGVNSTIKATSQVWITNSNGPYSESEYLGIDSRETFVYSPCFNLEELGRPMVSLDTWYDMAGNEGVILQYSTDDNLGAESWETVGSNISGINWYNEDRLTTPPGVGSNDFGYGWSGENSDETLSTPLQSKHSIDISENDKKKVIFRIVFRAEASPGSTRQGFAFDNFRIQNRNRVVLIEDFQSNSQASIDDNNQISDYAGENVESAVRIHYRAEDENDDFFSNSKNKSDFNSRSQYYDVTGTPESILGGFKLPSAFSANSFDPVFTSNGSLVVDTISLSRTVIEIPEIRLNISQAGVEIDVTSISTINEDFIVNLAIVEDSVQAEGQTVNGLLRQLLPSPSGTLINLDPNETTTVGLTWSEPFAENPENLAVIAFVQRPNSQEVLQAKRVDIESGLNVITSLGEELLDFGITVYPIPASDYLQVNWEDNTLEQGRIRLFDIHGRIAAENMVSPGQTSMRIPVQEFSPGVYYLQVESSNEIITTEKVIISH